MQSFLAVALVSLMIFASISTHSQGQKDNIHRKAKKIQNQYIVVLDDSVVGEKGPYSIAEHVAADMARSYGGKLKHVYKHALNGFSVEMTEAQAETLRQDYRVKFRRRGRRGHSQVPLKIIRRGDSTASISATGRSMLNTTTRQLAPAFTSTSSTPAYVARTRSLADVQ